MTTTSARMLQEGRLLQIAHAASSTTRPGLAYDDYFRPRDADPKDTPRFAPPDRVAHFQNADVRLDPDVLVRVVADVLGTDVKPGEAYVLGLMAGVALGQELIMDLVVVATMDETPDPPTVPTGPTVPRRVHHLRPGRRP